jgi:Ca-activated chloride channel family protein
MFLGMDAGALEIQRTASPNQNKRMILLTDGETEGEDMCRNSASRNAYLPATGCGSGLQSHMSISTLGVGKKYNEDLLSKIAEITIGRFYHLNDPGQIGGILQREFYNASGSVISRAKLNLMLEDGVRLETLDIIYPGSVRLQPVSEAGGKVLTAGLGSLQGEQATILGAQLKLPLQPAGRRQIAGVSVNYSIPGLNIEDRVENSSVFVEYTGDASLCSRVDREVISYFNQVSTQKLVEQAITESRQGNITAATRSLAQAQEITQRLGNLPLAQTIKDAREELTQKGTISEEGLKTIKSGSRFTVKLDKNTIRKI